MAIFVQIDQEEPRRLSWPVEGLPDDCVLVDPNDWLWGPTGTFRICLAEQGLHGLGVRWALLEESKAGFVEEDDEVVRVPARLVGLFASYEDADALRELLVFPGDAIRIARVARRFLEHRATFRELRIAAEE